MPQCWVICLYISGEGVRAVHTALPPMTLPQSVLPDGARFAGVGVLGQDDAYLYVVKGTCRDESALKDEILLDRLLTLAKKDAPQDFVLTTDNGAWVLTTKDLEQDVF